MDLFLAFLESAFRVSVPLLFAAYGGLISERAGLANIALEGLLLISAFSGAAAALLAQDPWVGLGAAVIAGAFGGLLFGGTAVKAKADHIVIGTAFNMLMMGMIPTIGRSWYGVTGGTPQLDRLWRIPSDLAFFVIAIAVGAVLYWALGSTRWGLRLKAAGDAPEALVVQGIDPGRVRILASVIGGAVVGFGGANLSLCQGSGYIRDMAGGRGFIALAALIFGRWHPVKTAIACMIFAAADAVQMLLQGQSILNIAIPNSLVQILPYVAVFASAYFFKRPTRGTA